MYKVVLIDDEPWSSAVLVKSVNWEELGFYVSGIYQNSTKAYEEISKNVPDVIITDIAMPVLNGLDLISKVKKASTDTRFIILSAYKDFEYAKTAMKLGVADYCVKPVDTTEIIDLLIEIKLELDEKFGNKMYSDIPQDKFEEIALYIEENIHDKLSLLSIAEKFFVSRTYICVLFRKNKNLTFSQYLTNIRIDRSKFLLKNTNMKLLEIAEKVGFQDEYYFSKVFKKNTGKSPSTYRKDKEVEYE